MFSTSRINSYELFNQGNSLLAEHYVSQGAENIRKLSQKKTIPLGEVADVIQVIIFGKKQMQCSPNKGIPLYSGSEILKIEPTPSTYLHKERVKNFPYGAVCEKNWILLTLSGTVGNISYVDRRFEGTFVTDDAMRIIAKKVPWGFLYTLLKSGFYKSVIENLQYGTVVKHVHHTQIKDIPIPLLAPDIMTTIHTLIEEAARLRAEANQYLDEAKKYFQLGIPEANSNNYGIVKADSLLTSMLGRANVSRGAYYRKFMGKYYSTGLLKNIADIIQIVIFGKKAMQCDSSRGYTLYSGSQLSKLQPNVSTYIHKKYVNNFKYGALVKHNWILLSLSGTIGYATISGKRFDNTFVTDDAMRIIAKDENLIGFLYAYIKSEIFQSILQSLQYGSVVQHINYRQVRELPYPVFSKEITEEINRLAIFSHEKFEKSLELEQQAVTTIKEELA